MAPPETPSLRLPEATPVRTHLGVIDVGTNAIRLQVARVFHDGTYRVIHDEREAVRLGEELFRTGTLSQAAVRRALDTLSRFSATAQKHGAQQVRSVATSAVREASNGSDFALEVEKTTGLRLEVISGVQEAQLIARGVLSCFGPPRQRVALVDLGGGSTEVSVVERGEVRFTTSVPLGSVRLKDMFCHSDPLAKDDERRLRQFVRDQLRRDFDANRLPACPLLVGSAGTVGALANFIRQQPSRSRAAHLSSRFTVRELNQASALLRSMTLEARRRAPGVEEHRAETIVAGAILLEEICTRLRCRTVKLVRRGLRDGLMLEEIERLGLRAPADAAAAGLGAPPPREVA